MKKLLLTALSALCVSVQAQQHLVGGDISLLPSYEKYNTPYYNTSGTKINDVVTYLHDECGWNACRVRLFVNPSDPNQEGVVQDVAYAKDLCKRIKEAGMKLMIDFHYSDTWADPTAQSIPSSWKTNTSNEALADSVYQYTKRSLTQLKEAGAEADYVQIGNEISYGMLWRNTSDKVYPSQSKSQNATAWARLSQLLNKGCQAVREVCPNAKIVIHTERAKEKTQTVNFYNYISDVDYDIIGLSYYCFWHGSLSTLGGTLDALKSSFPGKEVQIVETAYYYQYYPSTSDYVNYTSVWPATETGQQQYVKDLVNELKQHDNAKGLYYWFPEENGNGGASWNANTIVIKNWLNRGLWNDNTHKALKALYELKELRAGDASIEGVTEEQTVSGIYSLDGRYMGTTIDQLPRGFYVLDGKKVMKE